MKDVVKTGELVMWESPPSLEPNRRLVGVMFGREITPTTDIRAVIVILPVGQKQPKGRKNVHDKAEEIYYVLRGKGQFVLGERVVDIEKGTAVYVAPGTDHRSILQIALPVRCPNPLIIVPQPDLISNRVDRAILNCGEWRQAGDHSACLSRCWVC